MDRVDNVNFLHSYNLVVSSNKFHEAFKQVMLLAAGYSLFLQKYFSFLRLVTKYARMSGKPWNIFLN